MNGKDEEEKGEERKSGEKEDHEDGCFSRETRETRGVRRSYGEAPEPLR